MASSKEEDMSSLGDRDPMDPDEELFIDHLLDMEQCSDDDVSVFGSRLLDDDSLLGLDESEELPSTCPVKVSSKPTPMAEKEETRTMKSQQDVPRLHPLAPPTTHSGHGINGDNPRRKNNSFLTSEKASTGGGGGGRKLIALSKKASGVRYIPEALPKVELPQLARQPEKAKARNKAPYGRYFSEPSLLLEFPPPPKRSRHCQDLRAMITGTRAGKTRQPETSQTGKPDRWQHHTLPEQQSPQRPSNNPAPSEPRGAPRARGLQESREISPVRAPQGGKGGRCSLTEQEARPVKSAPGRRQVNDKKTDFVFDDRSSGRNVRMSKTNRIVQSEVSQSGSGWSRPEEAHCRDWEGESEPVTRPRGDWEEESEPVTRPRVRSVSSRSGREDTVRWKSEGGRWQDGEQYPWLDEEEEEDSQLSWKRTESSQRRGPSWPRPTSSPAVARADSTSTITPAQRSTGSPTHSSSASTGHPWSLSGVPSSTACTSFNVFDSHNCSASDHRSANDTSDNSFLAAARRLRGWNSDNCSMATSRKLSEPLSERGTTDNCFMAASRKLSEPLSEKGTIDNCFMAASRKMSEPLSDRDITDNCFTAGSRRLNVGSVQSRDGVSGSLVCPSSPLMTNSSTGSGMVRNGLLTNSIFTGSLPPPQPSHPSSLVHQPSLSAQPHQVPGAPDSNSVFGRSLTLSNQLSHRKPGCSTSVSSPGGMFVQQSGVWHSPAQTTAGGSVLTPTPAAALTITTNQHPVLAHRYPNTGTVINQRPSSSTSGVSSSTALVEESIFAQRPGIIPSPQFSLGHLRGRTQSQHSQAFSLNHL